MVPLAPTVGCSLGRNPTARRRSKNFVKERRGRPLVMTQCQQYTSMHFVPTIQTAKYSVLVHDWKTARDLKRSLVNFGHRNR
jgi:hypothetical protein